jgi:hypothetical protein
MTVRKMVRRGPEGIDDCNDLLRGRHQKPPKKFFHFEEVWRVPRRILLISAKSLLADAIRPPA